MKVRSDRMRDRSGIAGGVIDFSFVRYLLNCDKERKKNFLEFVAKEEKKNEKEENKKRKEEEVRFRSGQKSS